MPLVRGINLEFGVNRYTLLCYCCSITKLCLSLRPRGLQHAQLSCPSLSPGACSNSCLLSRWCHPTISSSVVPFSCLQSLPTKVHLIKAMVFPVVMYGCESWIIKKADRWRTDAFELWCWRKLLRVPWTARRSNQSILKEISPDFIGRTDAEVETPTPCPPDVKNQLIGKIS